MRFLANENIPRAAIEALEGLVHMDTFLLRNFQRQVVLQCKFMLTAAQELNKALEERGNTEHVFYALQNLLNAGANMVPSRGW